MPNSSSLLGLLLVFCSLAVPAQQQCTETEGLCILGIFPHTSTRQIESTYSSIAEELSLVLDRDVQLVTTHTIPRFLEKLRQHRYDIAISGLGHFLTVAEPAGYIPLARRENPLHFLIITLPDRNIAYLEDIRGRRLGMMPAENATTVATLLLLREHGIEPLRDTEVINYASQQACIHGLITDIVDVCGLAEPVVSVFERQMNIHFEVIRKTEPFDNISYIASPRLTPQQLEDLRAYFGQREGFVPAAPEDYARFRDKIQQFMDSK